jgi:cytochrome b6-f complex iron-sulfur subunit
VTSSGVSRRWFLGAVAFFAVGCRSGGRDEGTSAAPDHRPGEPVHVADARAYLVAVPEAQRASLLELLPEPLHAGVRAGVLALSQRCPEDGCRVPFCRSSGWFECGCHGQHFTELGALRKGRAAHGLDMFPVSIDDDEQVVIDTSRRIRGLDPGTYDTEAEPVGPHCVSG